MKHELRNSNLSLFYFFFYLNFLCPKTASAPLAPKMWQDCSWRLWGNNCDSCAICIGIQYKAEINAEHLWYILSTG